MLEFAYQERSHRYALRACARILKRERASILLALFDSRKLSNNRHRETDFQLKERTGDALAMLVDHLRGMPDRGALYFGQLISELTDIERPRAENVLTAKRQIQQDAVIYNNALALHATEEQLTVFNQEYRRLTHGLVTEASRHVRTLFVGDCLMSEILSFAVGPLMNDGLSVEPFPINPRTPSQLADTLDKLSTKTFDVVFFSPFSHARTAELDALLDIGNVFSASSKLASLCDTIVEQTRRLLDELIKRFECPIFIHNAGLVPRGGNVTKVVARLILTYRSRRLASRRLNSWLSDYIDRSNAETFHHLLLIDEGAIVSELGRAKLGKFLATSKYQHASVLSQKLAGDYCVRLSAIADLLGKKLVVCDLDNTLWDGVIGEGAVVHFRDRQRSLQHLRLHAGVVLSIASKNDPRNVNFNNGLLGFEDFVAPQINWNPKSMSIERIRDVLNLQTKHMVFLDDRAEERAAVKDAFPDILTLDPNQSETWEKIKLWNDIAFGSSDVDRTKMYQAQALRDAALETSPHRMAADEASLKNLNLSIVIRRAKRGDLKRLTELVNRTNQWNLSGTRTTYQQMRAWHEAKGSEVLLAEVSDRFGHMGTVCATVVLIGDNQAEILVFVLSCRAFGYGVETSMLREIGKRCAIGTQRKALLGHFRANAQNHPCRNMYPDHGFNMSNGAFLWEGFPPLPEVPWAVISTLD
jgi:FkbH-like protein